MSLRTLIYWPWTLLYTGPGTVLGPTLAPLGTPLHRYHGYAEATCRTGHWVRMGHGARSGAIHAARSEGAVQANASLRPFNRCIIASLEESSPERSNCTIGKDRVDLGTG